MRFLFVLLLAGSLCGQGLRIDLSSDWQFTRPDGTSSQVKSLGPRSRLVPVGTFWLKKTVEIPPWANQPLSLTLGNFGETYEVYINGRRVGGRGSFNDPWKVHFARPAVYPVPAGVIQPGVAAEIAIRSWIPPGGTTASWVVLSFSQPDRGPYVLTDAASAPHLAVDYEVKTRFLAATPYAIFAGIEGVFALVLLLLYVSDRASRQLGLLAAMLALLSVHRAFEYIGLLLDLPMPAFYAIYPITSLVTLCLVMFVNEISAVRLTWVNWLAGVALALRTAILVVRWSGGPYLPVEYWQICSLVFTMVCAVGMLIAGLWRSLNTPNRRLPDVLLHLIAIPMLLLDLARYSFIGGLLTPYYSNYRLIAGMWWHTFDFCVILLSAVAAILLLRQVAADRRDKLRMASELEAARIVQQLLLSGAEPPPGYRLEAIYRPAQEVGGDFYQTYRTEDGGLLIVVGDVSGKGLKAAMVVSMVVGALGNRRSDDPGLILAELNQVLCGRLDGGFVTCCCIRLSAHGDVVAANAGHLSPYRNGAEWSIPAGLPLGVVPGAAYDVERIDFGNGDGLTLLTDGVVEAANAHGELFGFARTVAIGGKPAREIAETACAWGQNDDITVVTVRSNG